MNSYLKSRLRPLKWLSGYEAAQFLFNRIFTATPVDARLFPAAAPDR